MLPASTRGVRKRRRDPLSLEMRRWFLIFLVFFAGWSWFAMTAFTRAQKPPVTADKKTLECDLIEDQGEYWMGELSECRNTLASIRLRERR